MSKQFDDKNKGAIFRNKRKESEAHPDGTGQLSVECPHCKNVTDYWVSSWNNTMKSTGEPYRSIKIKPKDGNESRPAKVAAGIEPPIHDDEIPF